MAKNKSLEKPHPSKKQLKKELAGKIESVLPDFKTRLGKKKFEKRLKKVTKLLVAGIHMNGADKKVNQSLLSSGTVNKIEVADKAV